MYKLPKWMYMKGAQALVMGAFHSSASTPKYSPKVGDQNNNMYLYSIKMELQALTS